jgi:hypothetical protein
MGFLTSCQPKNSATDFRVNINAITGEDAAFNTMEEVPVTIGYSLIPDKQSIDPWLQITRPSSGELKKCVYENKYSFKCEYHPLKDFHGREVIQLSSGDGGVKSRNTISVVINVENVPDAPIAHSGELAMSGNQNKSFTLRATDVDSSNLTYEIISVNPALSQSQLTCTGKTCSYRSLIAENGPVSIGFKVSDEMGLTANALFTINVTPLKPPVATNMALNMKDNESKNFVLGATDPDSTILNYNIMSVTPAASQSRINCNGKNCSYKSLSGEIGLVTVRFKVRDEAELSSDGIAQITVIPSQSPVAKNESLSMVGGEEKHFILSAVDNDSPAHNLSYAIISVTPSAAMPNLICNGKNCTYKSLKPESGVITINFKVTDETSLSSQATFTITVDPLFYNETVNFAVGQRGVDILWVVDNSLSMIPFQDKLAVNFDSFISNFLSSSIDFPYKMGVTSTDAYKSISGNKYYKSLAKNASGNIYDLSSNRANTDSVGLKQDFMNAVRVGAEGSTDEKALNSVISVLENPSYSTWFSNNRDLAIIIISDEEEQSFFYEKNGLVNKFSVPDWVNKFRSLRLTPQTVTIYPIVNFLRDDHSQRKMEGEPLKERYKQIADLFKTQRLDINLDFSLLLNHISIDIMRRLRLFNFNPTHSIIVNTLEVKVDGIIKTKEIDYKYQNNSIEFIKIPNAGANIMVKYKHLPK